MFHLIACGPPSPAPRFSLAAAGSPSSPEAAPAASPTIRAAPVVSFPLLMPFGDEAGQHKGSVRVGSSNWEFAPVAWVFDNGTYDRPIKAFGENSALMSGIDLMFKHESLLEKILGTETQYFIISPYYQTDMYFNGRAEGASLSAEGVRTDWHLGAMYQDKHIVEDFLNGYVSLRPEADFLSVDNPGQTNLMQRHYEWLGGTARAYLYLFPSRNNSAFSPPTWLQDRISLIGTSQYFWDPQISRNVRYYSAEVQYNLAGDKTNNTAISGGNQSSRQPTAAISVEYDYGIDRDMLVNINRYLVKLNVKY
jgi:hypothetical protein